MIKEQSMRAKNLLEGHQSRRSTGSATLHSLVSGSDDDDNDYDVKTSSSDEKSDSCYLDDDDVQWNANDTSNTTVPAAPARVWTYGKPPTISDPLMSMGKKKDSISLRLDCIMRHDRSEGVRLLTAYPQEKAQGD